MARQLCSGPGSSCHDFKTEKLEIHDWHARATRTATESGAFLFSSGHMLRRPEKWSQGVQASKDRGPEVWQLALIFVPRSDGASVESPGPIPNLATPNARTAQDSASCIPMRKNKWAEKAKAWTTL